MRTPTARREVEVSKRPEKTNGRTADGLEMSPLVRAC